MAGPPPPQSSLVTSTRAASIALDNLYKIFSNRDPVSRLAAIKATYHPDFTVHEPNEAIVRGYDDLSTTVAKLLDERAGWEFVALPTGVKGSDNARGVRVNRDYVGVEWGFGPKNEKGEVDVKVSGSDVIFVEKGDGDGEVKIKTLYVVIDGLADTGVKI